METSIKFYLGIDVSKSWFDVSVLKVVNHEKQPMLTEQFLNTKEGISSFQKRLEQLGVPFD